MNSAMRRKADKTGRSSGRIAESRIRKMNSPPKGETWGWMTTSMLQSPAFAAMSGNAMKVVLRVWLEHTAHKGTINGDLPVTFNDFENFGVRRNSIRSAIGEACALGFIDQTAKGCRSWGELRGTPARYRLTWLPTWRCEPPTNRWKTLVDGAQAQAVATAARQKVEQPPASASRPIKTVRPAAAL